MAVNEMVVAGRRRFVTKDAGGQTYTAFADIKTVDDLKFNIESLRSLDVEDLTLQPYAEVVQNTVDEYTSEHFQNIRGVLGNFIGQKVIDITQIDDDEWKNGDHPYLMLMFENGSYLKLYCCGMGFEFLDAVTGLEMPLAMPGTDIEFEDEDDDDEDEPKGV